MAGAALVGLILVVLLPFTGSTPAPAGSGAQSAPMLDGGAGAAGAAAAGSETPPPLTGTPREQADRLFNLIMQNREKGDTARARFFVPMGVQAYQMAGDLDADGLFHLSLLQTLGGNASDGLATARKILATAPTHLLGLVAAAEAAAATGDATAARGYYESFLGAYSSEKGKDIPEYREHAAALPAFEAEARRFLGR